jgi:hypothetical protein
VAVVELVSPANKDRDEKRRAFAAKCAGYLQRGVGLLVVDVVTSRHANLHNELIRLLELQGPFNLPAEAFTYAVAYRPTRRGEANETDVWAERLTVGAPLPVMPLALRGGPLWPVNLEEVYVDVCQRSRLM